MRGQIYIKLSTDRAERVEPGSRLWAGEWFEVQSSQSMFNTGPDRWVLRLKGVDDRGRAEALVNRAVYAEPIDDPDAVWVHQVIGARVVDLAIGELGRCASVVANPADDLLELEDGVLIPVVFVRGVEADGDGFVCTVDIPEGLLEAQRDDETDR